MNRDAQTNNSCFICGIERHDFDKAVVQSAGFSHHRNVVHNSLYYLYFVIHIWQQAPEDDNDNEMHVRNCLASGDISWFPIGVLSEAKGTKESDQLLLAGAEKGGQPGAGGGRERGRRSSINGNSRGGGGGGGWDGKGREDDDHFDVAESMLHMQRQIARLVEGQGARRYAHHEGSIIATESSAGILHTEISQSMPFHGLPSPQSALSPHAHAARRASSQQEDTGGMNALVPTSSLGSGGSAKHYDADDVNKKLSDITSVLDVIVSRLDRLERKPSPSKSRKGRSAESPGKSTTNLQQQQQQQQQLQPLVGMMVGPPIALTEDTPTRVIRLRRDRDV